MRNVEQEPVEATASRTGNGRNGDSANAMGHGKAGIVVATDSVAEFKVKHLMISNVNGVFAKVTTLTLDESDLTRSKAEA